MLKRKIVMAEDVRTNCRLGRRGLIAGMGAGLGALALAPRARAMGLDSLADALVEVKPPVPPPAFTFRTASGALQTLADYRGKGVVLNIWATWCAPCVAEMSGLDRLAGTAVQFGILVLPVSIDAEGLAAVKPFYQGHDITHLPMLLDPNSNVARAFKVEGIPTSFLIDRAGRVAGHVEGPVEWDTAGALAAIRGLVNAAPDTGLQYG
jgi:peroxiredoxin